MPLEQIYFTLMKNFKLVNFVLLADEFTNTSVDCIMSYALVIFDNRWYHG